MAIQTRRGNYADFDPDKMLPGELATVTSGDPGAKDGRSVYACFAAGDVKRMATYEDMEENIDRATRDVQEAFSAQLTQKISQADTAISQAQSATSAANTAAQGANEARQEALDAAAAAESYVLGDISSKTVTFSEASSRANIKTGERTSTLFGKIKKWFSDLKAFAFLDLAQDTETDDENRAASAAVTRNLQGKINELNTKIGKVQILSLQIVNVSCAQVQPNQTGQATANIAPVEGAEAYSAVLAFTGWLSVSAVTRSGTTLNVSFLNNTQGVHTGYCQFVVFAYKVL